MKTKNIIIVLIGLIFLSSFVYADLFGNDIIYIKKGITNVNSSNLNITPSSITCPFNYFFNTINISSNGNIGGYCYTLDLSSYVTFTYLSTNYYNKTEVNSLISNDIPVKTIYLGNDLSGLDGEKNRQLTILPATVLDINIDTFILFYTIDYTISGNTITFLNRIWDDQLIEVKTR